MNELSDWLLQNVETEDIFSTSLKKYGPDSHQPQIAQITFLNKCVTIKDSENLQPLLDVRILNCEDSYIYINQAVDCLFISECINCTVFCAAVRRVCTISNCENSTVTVAASTTRVGNCVDCNVYSYSHMGPPIIYGDTRNLLLGPHNAGYSDLSQKLEQASINIQTPDLTKRL